MFKLSLLLSLSAGKHNNTKTIPPFITDIRFAIRAMTSLNISNNKLAINSNAVQAGKALAEMLSVNSVLKELDVSANAPIRFETDGPGFAKELTVGVSANGALTSLNLASNSLGDEGAKHVAEAIKVNVSALRFDWYLFELDLTSGLIAVVYGFLP